MCLIVRSREDCRATEIDAIPGTAQVYSLPRQLIFFRTETYALCKVSGSIWARILHDCYTLITLLKCCNNLCMFVYQDSRNKSSPLCKMGFLLCAYFSISTIQVRNQCQINRLSWIQWVVTEYAISSRCLVLATWHNTNLFCKKWLHGYM